MWCVTQSGNDVHFFFFMMYISYSVTSVSPEKLPVYLAGIWLTVMNLSALSTCQEQLHATLDRELVVPVVSSSEYSI